MAAQGIVAGIRQGCEFLREGKAQIGEVKKAIGEVKAFVGEAKGVWAELQALWAMVAGLFGAQKPKQAQQPKAQPKESDRTESSAAPVRADKKSAERELSYEEYQAHAIHDICEKLKAFFEIKRQLKAHCAELEEISKTTTTVENSAIDRVAIEIQIEDMSVQIREAMVYAPKELKDIYSRFLKMYGKIQEEQEFARQQQIRKARLQAWRRKVLKDFLVDQAMALISLNLERLIG